jgi:transposase
VEKVRALLQESYGLRVSDGAVLGMEAHAAALLGPRYAQIQEQVRCAAFVGADETGFRVAGDNGWLWTFVTMEAVLYEAADTRGASVPKRVLEGFQGVLGRDAWDPYDKVACKGHQLDLQHGNRWLERAEHKADIEPRTLLSRAPAKKTRAGRPPAKLLRFVEGVRGLLQEAIAFVESKPPPGPRKRARAHRAYRRRLKRLLGRPWKHPDAVRISKELRARLDMVFTFVLHDGVPWHNNAAENAIRQGVLHRKASGGRRTRAGADVLALLLSVYRTCRQTGENFNAAVREVYAVERRRLPGVPSGAP